VSHSIVSRSITVHHDASLSATTMAKALDAGGFEVYDIIADPQLGIDSSEVSLQNRLGINWVEKFYTAIDRWNWRQDNADPRDREMKKRHIEKCGQCRAETVEAEQTPSFASAGPQVNKQSQPDNMEKSNGIQSTSVSDKDAKDGSSLSVVVDHPSTAGLFQASFAVGGMTCGSCVNNIIHALNQISWVRTAEISLLTNSASVTFEGKEHLSDIIKVIEDVGYEATLGQAKELEGNKGSTAENHSGTWRASYAISGMTCSSCVGTITKALQQHDWITSIDVNLISNSAVLKFNGRGNLPQIQATIEDVGYEATLNDLVEVNGNLTSEVLRKVAIRVHGMYCPHCPPRITSALNQEFGERVTIQKAMTVADPILEIEYLPRVPGFTIRHILLCLKNVDDAFEPSIHHPPTLEERSQKMQTRERTRVLFRLGLSVVAAIPTFIIGIVLMSLVPSTNGGRQFVLQPMWSRHVTRAEWALFIIATPVYLFAADAFHRPAMRELRALWRPGSKTPILRRFYRFGSMNMLISLGTTIAYLASVVKLGLTATDSSQMGVANGLSTYFDSVVFLTMFLLIGRFIEAYSKSKTGDAVALLGNLRPTQAILMHGSSDEKVPEDIRSSEEYPERVNIDLLEVGDRVNILHGDSPPSDGYIIRGESKFDESSLTGESRLVPKSVGDEVFSGTVNKAGPILIRVSKILGSSMLDQIVQIVREGQARRAPIERVADLLTGYFVPIVVLFAVSTWIIWMALGLSGSLPAGYLNIAVGGWPFWSLQFAIAAFVIACPCGIGLAAPTALFVGGGLAARYGILVKGGGEAFEEASHLDCIIFDKTGTLTEGGEPAITDYQLSSDDDEKRLLGMARSLEEQTSHPLGKAVVSFCGSREVRGTEVSDVEEIPGKGIKGSFAPGAGNGKAMQAIIGNQALLEDYGVDIPDTMDLENWKAQGKSVVLLAVCTNQDLSGDAQSGEASPTWKLSATFAASDPLRRYAAATVQAIQRRGIQVWMLSGDNPTTARAVGQMVGIPADNVIAGVLPEQKAEKVQYLQKTLSKRSDTSAWGWRPIKVTTQTRATIAMVGDGVNDSPALIQADVGIAIGSGSDVAISSAEFVLVSSNLFSLLTLIDLSRVVFRRVKINFLWALIYNVIGLPVAAGVLYPVVSKGQHVRLDPVWASLAMALSSVSVVCSSLLLKSRLPIVGFRLGKEVSSGS
jgi:Cu+-exporting ATPase